MNRRVGERRTGDRRASGGQGPERPALVVLLGAQRFNPTLRQVVDAQGIKGRTALITAGWQERELEDEELSAHLGGDTINLRLHARADVVFAKDREFHQAHRERQLHLRHLQEIYRIRLEHAFEADRDVHAYDAPAAIRDEIYASSLEAIRTLDAWHLGHCKSVREEFEARYKPLERDGVVRQRHQLEQLLAECSMVAIAGGHIAVLLNRLALFGMNVLIGGLPVFAWCAGAMAITERIVLFHDDPPEGRPARQVLDEGLGYVPSTVVLPNPELRLNLSAGDRISLVARRFSPATCISLPARSWVVWSQGQFTSADSAIALHPDGTTSGFQPQAEPTTVTG